MSIASNSPRWMYSRTVRGVIFSLSATSSVVYKISSASMRSPLKVVWRIVALAHSHVNKRYVCLHLHVFSFIILAKHIFTYIQSRNAYLRIQTYVNEHLIRCKGESSERIHAANPAVRLVCDRL